MKFKETSIRNIMRRHYNVCLSMHYSLADNYDTCTLGAVHCAL